MARPATKTIENGLKFSSEVLRKLEQAFSLGMSNKEACFLANVSESIFYNICKRNQGLSERFELLKVWPNLKARMTIVRALEQGDVRVAMWWLAKKIPEEFGTNPQPKSKQRQKIDYSLEAHKRLKKYL